MADFFTAFYSSSRLLTKSNISLQTYHFLLKTALDGRCEKSSLPIKQPTGKKWNKSVSFKLIRQVTVPV